MTKFEYFTNWAKEQGFWDQWKENEKNSEWTWKEGNPYDFTENAFNSYDTTEGVSFWDKIHGNWVNHINKIVWSDIENQTQTKEIPDLLPPKPEDEIQINKNINCIVATYRMITEGKRDITSKKEKELFIDIVNLVCDYSLKS